MNSRKWKPKRPPIPSSSVGSGTRHWRQRHDPGSAPSTSAHPVSRNGGRWASARPSAASELHSRIAPAAASSGVRHPHWHGAPILDNRPLPIAPRADATRSLHHEDLFRHALVGRRCVLALAMVAGNAASAQQPASRAKVVMQVSDADPRSGTSRSTTRRTSRRTWAPPTSTSRSSPTAPASACSRPTRWWATASKKRWAAASRWSRARTRCAAQKLTQADMLGKVGYVPAGVVEIMQRQQQGWAYIRP